jgi:hypothetical protein
MLLSITDPVLQVLSDPAPITQVMIPVQRGFQLPPKGPLAGWADFMHLQRQ